MVKNLVHVFIEWHLNSEAAVDGSLHSGLDDGQMQEALVFFDLENFGKLLHRRHWFDHACICLQNTMGNFNCYQCTYIVV